MVAILALVLAISPWTGKDLPAANSDAAKYRLTVRGTPGSTAHLHTSDVASGWIAAFCNGHVCAPNKLDQVIPASGNVALQFELIREDESAPHVSGATILADDGAKLSVDPVRR